MTGRLVSFVPTETSRWECWRRDAGRARRCRGGHGRDRSAQRDHGTAAQARRAGRSPPRHSAGSGRGDQVVGRLRLTHAGSRKAACCPLFDEFREARRHPASPSRSAPRRCPLWASRRPGERTTSLFAATASAAICPLPDALESLQSASNASASVAGARIAAGRSTDSERAQPRRAGTMAVRQWDLEAAPGAGRRPSHANRLPTCRRLTPCIRRASTCRRAGGLCRTHVRRDVRRRQLRGGHAGT
jgi:hypothetical protein